MSLFKKPKGKFRPRLKDTGEDDNNEDAGENNEQNKNCSQVSAGESKINDNEETEAGSSVVNHRLLDSEKKVDKVKLKLSFDDDGEEEADVFRVKKSAYSRRIAKQLKREKKKKEKEEKLEEAKKSESNLANNNNEEEDDAEMEIENFDTPTIISDFQKRDIPNHQFRPMKEGEFPSAKEIYAARKKREEDRKKLRMENVIDDFIAIEEETAAERTILGLVDDEQPVYDEEPDNDDDEDDDDRIDFAVDREALERERAKTAFIQAQEEDEETFNRVRNHGDEDDSEDEIDLWEKEQIRKGVGFLIGNSNRDQSNNQLNDLMTKLDLPTNNDKFSSSIPSYLPKTPNGKAFEALIDQISDSISQMQREIDDDERELRSVIAEREQLTKEVKELEERLKENGEDDDTLTERILRGETSSHNDRYDSSDDDY